MKTLREEYVEKKFSEVFKTITADNGTEFERLSELEALEVRIYFVHMYSFSEGAKNERHNRIFRRYISKGISIEKYSANQITWYINETNGFSREHFRYKTLAELFEKLLDHVYSVVKIQVT